jgi:hypothetical protein
MAKQQNRTGRTKRTKTRKPRRAKRRIRCPRPKAGVSISWYSTTPKEKFDVQLSPCFGGGFLLGPCRHLEGGSSFGIGHTGSSGRLWVRHTGIRHICRLSSSCGG